MNIYKDLHHRKNKPLLEDLSYNNAIKNHRTRARMFLLSYFTEEEMKVME